MRVKPEIAPGHRQTSAQLRGLAANPLPAAAARRYALWPRPSAPCSRRERGLPVSSWRKLFDPRVATRYSRSPRIRIPLWQVACPAAVVIACVPLLLGPGNRGEDLLSMVTGLGEEDLLPGPPVHALRAWCTAIMFTQRCRASRSISVCARVCPAQTGISSRRARRQRWLSQSIDPLAGSTTNHRLKHRSAAATRSACRVRLQRGR